MKVMPVDYKKALEAMHKEKQASAGKPAAQTAEVARG